MMSSESPGAFQNWLETAKAKKKKNPFTSLFGIFGRLFPSEEQRLTKYLSESTSLEDLERRQRDWEREKYQPHVLNSRSSW